MDHLTVAKPTFRRYKGQAYMQSFYSEDGPINMTMVFSSSSITIHITVPTTLDMSGVGLKRESC